MIKTKISIDNVDYTNHCTMPIQQQNTADESLDAGYLELFCVDKQEPIKPFNKCKITTNDGETEESEYYDVASDECDEVIKQKKYNHDLVLIEETKLLERYIVDVKTLTNPIVHNYLDNPSKIMANGNTTTYWVFNTPFYITFDMYSPQEKNKPVTVPRPYYLLKKIQDVADTWDGGSIVNVELSIYDKDGERVWYGYDGWSSLPTEKTFTFTPTKTGEYTFKLNGTSTIGITQGEVLFKMTILERTPPKIDYTIKNACEILLATCETLRQSETPKFTLAQANDYPENVRPLITKIFAMKSPEFSHTKCTLFEALKEIGDYVHAIPRLKQNKVYFDLLGTNTKCTIDLEKYISNKKTQSIDKFCSELDTNVENLVNTDDDKTGSMTEPYNNQFKTLRVEKGVAQITEGTIKIETDFPIYDIKSVTCGFLSDENKVGDITPFIYENAEYQTLSGVSDSFPTAKMFALKYTQGQKDITGLNYKNGHIISEAFEDYAITNIIHKKLNLATNWWQKLWNKGEDIYDLQFIIVYTPIINTRLKQVKTNVEDLAFRSVLIHNQSSNMISSNAYGEHLRGVVAKYGVPEKKLMLMVTKLSQIPKINTIYKDYTITSVKKETYNNFFMVEVGLSKKFNNKSAYISLNNQKRFYEVSEKACAERYVLYEDYCVIGDNFNNDNKSLITPAGITAFKTSFTDGETKQISAVKAQGFDSSGNGLEEVAKSIFALGVGTSLLFGYAYDDNFSAGMSAQYEGKTKVQNYVKYADVYGEIETLKLRLGRVTNIMDSYNMSVTRGNLTPKGNAIPDGNFIEYFSTGTDKIVIMKDSREKLSVSYQMHFVTNRPNMIIGTGIGRKNVFTSSESLNYKLYILPSELNEFDRTVDLTNAQEVAIQIEDIAEKKIKIKDVVASVNGKSWALVNVGSVNELLIGENIEIKSNQQITLPYFTFTRKLANN